MLDREEMLDADAIYSHDDAAPRAARPPECGRIAWAVVHTHPQAERWAHTNITRVGYEAYLPLAMVRRRDPVIHSRWHEVLAPLFSRYLFVRLGASDPWTPIRYAPGVRSLLLAQDSRPATVPASDVEALQATEAARQHIRPPATRYAPGHALRFTAGPFSGIDCVVARTHHAQAVVACIVMSALRNVTVPLEWLGERT